MFLHGRQQPCFSSTGGPSIPIWQRAWRQALGEHGAHEDPMLRETFIRWLCSDLVRAQTSAWIRSSTMFDKVSSDLDLGVRKKIPARNPLCEEKILDEAKHLYAVLIQSRSSRAVLKAAANDRIDLLPGAKGASRILAVCERPANAKPGYLFTDRHQPDTAIAVFNSPFGPDVLIGTDRLSEGIDLHRYCRHLIHYDLDPGPIRTVQRNGRLRRVGGWASVIKRKIRYAYPAFRGTRDYRLVQIMKKRIDSFSRCCLGRAGIRGSSKSRTPTRRGASK